VRLGGVIPTVYAMSHERFPTAAQRVLDWDDSIRAANELGGVLLDDYPGDERFDELGAGRWRCTHRGWAVREADLEDDRYDAPEAPGFDVVLRALSLVHDDDTVLAMTAPVFDAVYEYLRREVLTPGRAPA
jgi:hypothetical protein